MTSRYDPTADEMAFAQASMPEIKQNQAPSVPKSRFDPTDEDMVFAQGAMAEPLKPEVSRSRSLYNAAKKGFLEATVDIGELVKSGIREDPFGESGKQFGQVLGVDIMPKSFQEKKKELVPTRSEKEQSEFKEQLEEKLPSEKGFAEGAIRRGSRLAPTALIGPGGLVEKGARTGIAAVAGETAKELGAGEGLQTLAEIAAFSAPDLAKKLYGANPRQQAMIDLARNKGLSEEEIAPAIQQESTFRRFLGRLAYKGTGTQDRLTKSRKAVGNIYNELRKSPEAGSRIPRKDIVPMLNEYGTELMDLNPSERQKLKPVFKQLLDSKGTGEDFIRFYQHAYQEVSDPKKIGRLQDVTRRAVDAISPELGKDFRLTNELYSNILNTGHQLRPPAHPDIMLYVKGMSALYGLWTGDYTWLAAATAPLAARKIATEYLLNPRLQNLGTKAIRAINNHQVPIANKLFNEFKSVAKEESPELYEEIKGLKAQNFIQDKQSKESQK